MISRCWFCDAETAASQVLVLAVLTPRTAREGGPALHFRCRRCGEENLVERNAGGEVLLSPPLLAGIPTVPLRRVVIYAAKRWAAEHAEERRRFLQAGRARSRPAADRTVRPAAEETPLPPPPSDPEPESGLRTAVDRIGVGTLVEAYEVLGLPLTAPEDAVRERYRELARKCHPDRVADLDEEIRELAERKFRRLSAALELALTSFRTGDRRPRPDSR